MKTKILLLTFLSLLIFGGFLINPKISRADSITEDITNSTINNLSAGSGGCCVRPISKEAEMISGAGDCIINVDNDKCFARGGTLSDNCAGLKNCEAAETADIFDKCCVLKNKASNSLYGTSLNCDLKNETLCKVAGGTIYNCKCSVLKQCDINLSDTACPSDKPAAKSVASTGGSKTQIFTNPLEYTTLEGFVQVVLNRLKSIVAILAILMAVLGGVMYVISAGNPKLVTAAKACWTSAAIGFAIVIAAPSFLKEIGDIFGLTSTGSAEVDKALSLSQIALNVLNFLLSIIGILAIIMIVIGGIMYMVDFGSEKRSEMGKKIIGYAIVGLVVALSSLILVKQIGNILTRGSEQNNTNTQIEERRT